MKRIGRLTASVRALALVANAALATASCGENDKICSTAGCFDGLAISLRGGADAGAGSGLVDGNYAITVEADGRRYDVACRIPSSERPCDSNELMASITQPPAQLIVYVPGTPDSVSMKIAKDGVNVSSMTIAPRYHDISPNGVHCPPTCSVSELDVEL